MLVTSWGDHRIEQYRLEPHGASFRAVMKPVVAGGDDFRPVGIATAPDGSVYISDWVDKSYTLHGKGRIWRLRQVDMNVVARLDPDIPVAWRSAAIALGAAAGTGKVDGQLAASVLHHDSADVRALGVGILPADQIKLKDIAGTDPSPLVRAAAMRRISDSGAKGLLLKAFDSDDPFVQQAARLGLWQLAQERTSSSRSPAQRISRPTERLGLLLILRDSDHSDAKTVLPGFLSDPDPRIRFAAIQWVGEHRLAEFRSTLQAGLGFQCRRREISSRPRWRRSRDWTGRREAFKTKSPVKNTSQLSSRTNGHPPKCCSKRSECCGRTIRHSRLIASSDCWRNQSEAVRIEAVRSLCQSRVDGRFEILARLAGDQSASPAIRAEAIAGLAEKAAAHREVLLALASGAQPVLRHEALRSLRGVSLSESERSILRRSNRDDAAGLELVDFLQNWGASGQPQSKGARAPGSDIDAWFGSVGGPGRFGRGRACVLSCQGAGMLSLPPGSTAEAVALGRTSRIWPPGSTAGAWSNRSLHRARRSPRSSSPILSPAPMGLFSTAFCSSNRRKASLIFADSQGRQDRR